MLKFSSVPDTEKYPPSTAVTPQQIEDSEKALSLLRASGAIEQIAEAEAAHRGLCHLQNEQLRQIHRQRELDRFKS
jgi:hypothetical protein